MVNICLLTDADYTQLLTVVVVLEQMIGVMFLNDVMGRIRRFQQCGLFTENTFDVKLKVAITSTGENAIKLWCDFIISTSILRLLFLFEVMTI